MSNRRVASLALGLALAVAAAACNTGTQGSAAPKGTVNIAVNPWVGYTASAAVVAYILKEKMGYTVNLKDLKEDVSWQGFESGEVDAILEDWGHPELEKLYVTDKKVAMDAGLDGNVGIIGWYVPKWFADEHPDVTADVMNLNKYVDLFKTSESGDKGQFLGTDPSYVQYDEALVANLGLNFKVNFTGSENATVAAIQQAVAQKKPLLFYWWDPHWLNSVVELTRVKLPAYTAGCDADPKTIKCDYPETPLRKFISTKFNSDGGAAATFIKNWKWTNKDQNFVADLITNGGLTSDAAAKKWVDANPTVWEAWIPK
jgi:glycine betaine/proline transport system substrate-binding protein